MPKVIKPKGYWTKEKCIDEALKYDMLSKFQKGSRGAYNRARKENWLDDICDHMINQHTKHKQNGYWTKGKCQEESIKYQTRVEYRKLSGHSYNIARLSGWLDDICSHMKIIGNNNKRCIYVYEFSDNHAYVGLTYNLKVRNEQHVSQSKSAVYKHMQQTLLTPTFKQLTDYLSVEDAIDKESYFVEYYKSKDWKILNRTKTGSIGCFNLELTKEKCQEEALKYNTIKDFRKNSHAHYLYSWTNKWLNEVCSHMTRLIKPNGYWTRERCKEEASKYNSKKDFRKNCHSAYNASCENNWIAEVYFSIRS